MRGEILGPNEEDGTPPQDADSEQTPAHLKKRSDEEQRFEVLRSMRDAGEIEAGTEEMKIIAANSPEDTEKLTERGKKMRDAIKQRLEDRDGRERPVQNVQNLIASLKPTRRGGRSSDKK